MPRVAFRSPSGQASVELVALLPVLGALVLAGWQVAVAGHTMWSASAAVRAASRAAAVGGDAERAARAIAGRSVRVRTREDGGVEVSLPIRAVAGGGRIATYTTPARFEPQR